MNYCLNCKWFRSKRSGYNICNLDGHYAKRFDTCPQWFISKEFKASIELSEQALEYIKNGNISGDRT